MKLYSGNITSDIESLKIKKSERDFYKDISERLEGTAISKIVPCKGISLDLMYIENNNILFMKFMDTSSDTYEILEEELIEVINEEYNTIKANIDKFNLDIKYNIVYIMPYVRINRYVHSEEFIKYHIIDKTKYEYIVKDANFLKRYFVGENEETILNLFRFYICSEYHVVKSGIENRVINRDFKRITFNHKNYNYSGLFLDYTQISKINSIKYCNSLVTGGSGSGKTTLLMSRSIKLSKLYPRDRFLFITHSKHLMNNIKTEISVLQGDIDNLDIYNFHGFVIKLAKQFNLVVDFRKLNENFNKYFNNIFLQVKNYLKDKVIYKGIFIDEGEKFDTDQIKFLESILYENKKILNISVDTGKNTSKAISIETILNFINIDEFVELNYNYRQTRNIVNFINKFTYNVEDYITRKVNNNYEYKFQKTHSLRNDGNKVQIIKVDTIDEKIETIIWEINHLVYQKGLNFSDIVVVYPFNKRKLKNGNSIYFQYILRKALENNGIPYIYGTDELNSLEEKQGVTITNICFANNVEYRAVIFCEIEMLYDHKINPDLTNYKKSKFVCNLNIVYTALTRSIDFLTIITTLKNEESDIMDMLNNSLDF
ncbi:UvrD/REP helicase N-terminal domain-containing protein [Alkalithermobacter thermoalcaliphilus JW-YL-7 = DSM 7308]|uniref:UvrD-like DNA helicase n=1 Tax=Alkalithermobacter thermoalcaliphilus JW-YL-7 = DSM 7308 TaxID=1121328 RepID=A0A150FQC3_CLOPD|nr:UvrD-like DNA helicase [[Clostridium] paradoxum JW-YL-7 = DSM 7308]SHK81073.1 UvrD/REP helicase N-terminal domain-containing protein [[Clostridium] paradoxum JW-YL-7 = DSM 7308]